MLMQPHRKGDDGLPDGLVETVDGYLDLNMLEDAAEECLRALDSNPDTEELLVYCAGKVSLGTSDQIKRLLVALERYLKKRPDAFAVREVRAVLLSLEKRYAESLDEFAKVPPEKRRHDAYWMWFSTLIDSGAKDQVRDWIANVWPSYSVRVRREDFRDYLKFLWSVSRCMVADGKLEEAAAGYRFLIQRDPGAIGAYLDYGRLLARMGKKKRAAEMFRRGLGLTDLQIDEQQSYPGGIIGYVLHERRAISREIEEELKKLASRLQKER